MAARIEAMHTMSRWMILLAAGPMALVVVASAALGDEPASTARPVYRSPSDVTISPDGDTIYVSDTTAAKVVVLDRGQSAAVCEVPVNGRPLDLELSRDGKTLYVAERGAGSVAMIDTSNRQVSGRIATGRWPVALALSPDGSRLYVCDQDSHTVSVIDLARPEAAVMAVVPVVREPSAAAVTPDGRTVVVANLVANGPGTDPKLAAAVSVIDAEKLQETSRIQLPAGSSVVRGLCLSPDGKYAYVVHGLGRFHLPITQLERGWVNTFALTVIDVAQAARVVTVLLDDLTQGAADPNSLVCSGDGRRLWITHSGVHEVSTVEIGQVHDLLAGNVPAALAELKDGSQPNIWVEIQRDREKIAELENHLTALYIAGAIRRAPAGGMGPRGVALSADDKTLCVANYYSGTVAVLDAESGKLESEIPLGELPEPDSVRRGEMIFHDANRAFQRWHSCASCHPNEGRVDGLRWDFLGDGMGNPKDTISLVQFHKTEPMNRRATLKSAFECARNGLRSTNMLEPTEQDVKDLFAYLTSVEPEPSPKRLADGSLNPAAERGRVLFEGRAGCAYCHPGPTFTDQKMHNVGTGSGHYEEQDGRYDVPSLVEAYRTAPYLHDGRAVTIREVLTTYNAEDSHGKAGGLSEEELNDLIEYVESL